ncbi:MAG TPA: hypothetical protein DF383_07550, partial [Deltaproteobacteria bacterium]|nr:hypothetical protein [Deltaproteobacteria bacterium]
VRWSSYRESMWEENLLKPEHISTLVAALKDKNNTVRSHAISILQDIRKKKGDISDISEAIPLLEKLTKQDPNLGTPASQLPASLRPMTPSVHSKKMEVIAEAAVGVEPVNKSGSLTRGAIGISSPLTERFQAETTLHYTRFDGTNRAGIAVGGSYLVSPSLSLGLNLPIHYDFDKKTLDIGLKGEVSYHLSLGNQRLGLGMFLEMPGLSQEENRNLAMGMQVEWRFPK